MNLLSQLHNTLERRRKGIAGEKQNKKFKEAAKQVIVLTAEEQKAREAEIGFVRKGNKKGMVVCREYHIIFWNR